MSGMLGRTNRPFGKGPADFYKALVYTFPGGDVSPKTMLETDGTETLLVRP